MTPYAFVRPRADADLREIYHYLAPRNVDAADRFLAAVAVDFDRLAMMPGIGARRPTRNSVLRDLRARPVSGFRNYVVFYVPSHGGIEVVRVLHAARDAERQLSYE